jgi:hypothetical protein
MKAVALVTKRQLEGKGLRSERASIERHMADVRG